MLYSQLESERSLKLEIETELTSVKNDILILEKEKSEFEDQNEKLKSELETIIKQRVDENQASLKDRNEGIDELVREVEHCINQLK